MKTLKAKLNVSLEILPFGESRLAMRGNEELKQNELERPVTYGEPSTTNQQEIKISIGGEEYRVPKSTGGVL